MKSRKLPLAALCTNLALLIASPLALGQSGPTTDRLPAEAREDLPPSDSETTGASMPREDYDPRFGPACCSTWTASAEFICLQRIGSVPYTLVETVPATVKYDDLAKTPGTPVLNADDFRHGFMGGPRVGLVHHDDDGDDFEVSYFQIDGWNSSRSVGPDPSDWLVMRGPGNFLQTQNDYPALQQAMVWDYASRLYNAEVNVRRNFCSGITVLAGFRWVNVTEDLEGILLPATAHGTGPFWDTETKNNLYGLQIGAEVKLLERERFSINGLLKTGLFDNHAEQATSVRMERIQFGDSATTDHLAFLGQIGLQGNYRVTPRLLLKAGYEALWLQGIALAPGQITETYSYGTLLPQDTYVQALGVNCGSSVLYHGASVGFEYAF